MKAFKFFLALVLLIAPFVPDAYSDNETSVVRLKHDNGTGSDSQKSGNFVPFNCLLVESNGVLVFQSSLISVTADVELINADTLNYTEESIRISSAPSYVYVPASGDYIINVTLDDGNSYTGYFSCSDDILN